MAAPPTSPDDRLHAPATQRNKAPITAVLARWLPAGVQDGGRVLELASGTGEHALHFAASFPNLAWQPSNADARARRSIEAYRRAGGLPNLLPPLALDVAAPDWPLEAPVDAMVCCNLLHIAPWSATEGLFAGAGRWLKPGGGLFVYGAFLRAGVATAPSNLAFDASLRAQNPAWGLRDLDAVSRLAAANGLAAPLVEAMPANNLSLWFARP